MLCHEAITLLPMKFGKMEILKALDNTLGPVLCRILGQIHFHLYPAHYPAPLDIQAVRKILVIRPGGIGDMMVMLPILSHLGSHLPHAQITIVCERRNRSVLTIAGFRGHVLTYDAFASGFLLALARGDYDMVIDSEQFHHFSAIFALISRAPIRIGFNINPRRNPLYTHLVPYSPNQSEFEQFMNLLSPLPIPKTNRAMQGSLENYMGSIPDNLLQKLAPDSHSPRIKRYVAIHPGSSSPYKHWEASKFTELCTILFQDMNILPVLIGGSEDTAFSAGIVEAMSLKNIPLFTAVGQLSLEKTTAVIQHASAFVGLDSGLAHIAVALKRPTVVLFGPTDPVKWGTDDGHHKIIYKAVPCSPCAIFGYFRPCNTFACMKLITTDDVIRALRKVL
jgi:ADP-heptose:LPS heptosyltransferase